MFTACMAISACRSNAGKLLRFCLFCANQDAVGDLFLETNDQVKMLEILRDTEKRHARPTEQVQNDMREKWKWT